MAVDNMPENTNKEKVKKIGTLPRPRAFGPMCHINKSILYGPSRIGQWAINGQGTPLLGQQC